ncbi:Pre-mRNA splicing [Coemansia thaxteri]|nr:Pre-mRNA splicing [Coemansia thaxteri]
MSEGFTDEHKKLYQYAGNSNLVLPSDRTNTGGRRKAGGAAGERGKEIESLWGKIDARAMGANVRAQTAPKPATKASERKQRKASSKLSLGYSKDDMDSAMYQPRTPETLRVWEQFLAQTRPLIGDQSPDVLLSAADEMLSILKLEGVKDLDKKKRVEALIGSSVSETEFSRFIQLGRQITDYAISDGMAVDDDDDGNEAGDREDGIAVVLGDSDSEDEGDAAPSAFVVDEASSDEDEEEEENEEKEKEKEEDEDAAMADASKPQAAATTFTSSNDKTASDDSQEAVSARSIDAFWLQRQVGKRYSDAVDVQEKTREALRIMSARKMASGEMENMLAEVLDYEHFDLVQTLVTKRDVIVWCMQLARAESSGDPEQVRMVEEEMRESGAGWMIAARRGEAEEQNQADQQQFRDGRTGAVDTDAFKMVYIAPMKALVAEMAGAFGRRLAPLGVRVAELTGDSQLTKQQITETQLIVTTPEKWDVVTRKGAEGSYTDLVRLVIVDEIHLLHDDRGPVLESVVSREIRRGETGRAAVRVVGLSATLPNYEDVAAFLRVRSAGVFHFDARFRPVPLDLQIVGISEKKAVRRVERMDQVCYEKVAQHVGAGESQVLVFVQSRRETVRTGQRLAAQAVAAGATGMFVRAGGASSEILREEAAATRDAGLRELLPFGIACHHAGMARVDRQVVEELFMGGHVRALVSTATLAWGVNLPAHAVVIRGTQVYRPAAGAWGELSPQDVLQMLGRAGRPQYDARGAGVIITTHGELRYYLSLLSHQLPIESQLVARLPDALNAEVALGAVASRADAAAWLARTFLFVRMLRSPRAYGVGPDDAARDPALARRRAALAHAAAATLERSGLVRYERRSGRLAATDAGRVAAHFYVGHRTMAAWRAELRADAGPIELLAAVARADEFARLGVRADERAEVARLAERAPVPVRDGGGAGKAAVLVQAHVSRLRLRGLALAADAAYVAQAAARLFRAVLELSVRRGWARAARGALEWSRQVERRVWAAETPLRQVRGAPPELLRAAERLAVPWARLADLGAAELAELVGGARAGAALHRLVHTVPRVAVRAHVQPLTATRVRVALRVAPDFAWSAGAHGAAERFWVWAEDARGAALLHAEPLVVAQAHARAEHVVDFEVAVGAPPPPQLFVHVASDRWVGADARVAVALRRVVMPPRAPPPTALHDVAPPPGAARVLGVAALTPVQAHVFHALHAGDASALVAAPPGAGKTRAADLALLRFLGAEAERARAGGDAYERLRAVYIAPAPAQVHARAADWRARLGALHGGTRFAVLDATRDAAAELRDAADAHVVLATPDAWDRASRRWRQRARRAVRDVGLVIADDAHRVASAPAYEAVVARVRLMAAQLGRAVRVVALAAPLANARDVAAWIGAPPAATFAFAPAARAAPLDVRVHASHVAHFASRMAALTPPVFRAVSDASAALVFVDSRRQCRRLAADLLALAAADGRPGLFASPERATADLLDPSLRELARCGVACFHDAMAPADRAAVLALFTSGAVRVLIAAREACWALDDVRAPLVVIMGAERFVGAEHRYADYGAAEVLQMVGRAHAPPPASAACVLMMCLANKTEHFKHVLHEPLTIESCLDTHLHDLMNAEVVAKTIEGKQDAVDYLTWSFLYRRLPQNPNYYGLQGTSHQQLSDYLSELIESTLSDLAAAKCLTIADDDVAVAPTNLGMIAAYYQISYLTVEMFALSLSAKTKLRGVLDIVSAADEFDALPIRHREGAVLSRIAKRLPVPLPSVSVSLDDAGADESRWSSPRVRTHLLLQAHFSRLVLPPDLAADQAWVLARALPLLQALVDVASSMGWLPPALAAMELSQMTVQAVWEGRDPLVRQVPHLGSSESRLSLCKELAVESVFDIMDMEDQDRARLLHGLLPPQIAEVAAYVNRYPNIEVQIDIADPDDITCGSTVSVSLTLDRESDDDELPDAIAPFFPPNGSRAEGWWAVVGDPKSQSLLAVKRVTVARHLSTVLEFTAPSEVQGPVALKLFLMCDAYLGCDQEFDLQLNVLPAPLESDSDQ